MRVLVVEDEYAIAEMVVDFLSWEGYTVIHQPDGRAAWQWLNETTTLPDVVLTDIMMPHLDGRELCKRIKEDPRLNHISVVMMSAALQYLAPEGRHPLALIPKPLDFARLLATLEQASQIPT